MKILIPTLGRETNQKCWESLPEDFKDWAFLCTREDKVELLQKNYPNSHVINLGMTYGIADVRQKLIEYFPDEKVFICDDNCSFLFRDENLKLHPITSAKFLDMHHTIENMLDTYPMVGISDRAGNNRVEKDFLEIGRSYSCYGINTDMFRKNDIRFDGMWRKNNEITQFEDFYVILSLLSKGLKNAIVYSYAFNHPHGKAGGNSLYRTEDLQEKCYKALQSEFPGIIKLKVKENASWTVGDSKDRLEAIVSWKKCYENSQMESLDEFF